MLYVVCVYFVVCGMCLILLPSNIPESRATRKSIFDKDDVLIPEKTIDEIVAEHLKDIPDPKFIDKNEV